MLYRIARRIRGINARAPGKVTSPDPDAHLTSAIPPWITLTPRTIHEERIRVIENLNDSFRNVALPATFQVARRKSINYAGVSAFEDIPTDALYMLLPLWPSDPDDSSTVVKKGGTVYFLPIEKRQYLIVYYASDKREDETVKSSTNEKTAQSNSSVATPPSSLKMKRTPQTPFWICARLSSYQDFLETRVRLPSEGLAVTGPLEEAIAALPPPPTHGQHSGGVVIGRCLSEEQGIDFSPEGFAAVGLSREVEDDQRSSMGEGKRKDGTDPTHALTPVGRAVVEMVWLGCLAINNSHS